MIFLRIVSSFYTTRPLEYDRKLMAPSYAGSLYAAWSTVEVAGIAGRMEGAAESSVFLIKHILYVPQ